MHPFLKFPKQVLLYFLAWLPLVAGIIYLFGSITQTGLLDTAILLGPMFIVEMFIFLSVWYVAKGVPLGINRVAVFLGTHLLTMIVMNAIWLYMAMLYSEVLNVVFETDIWRNIFNAMMPLLMVVGFFLYFLSGLLSYLLIALDKARTAERMALENKLRASQVELQILKASVHPHFLLNSISAVTEIIEDTPVKARNICRQLTDFLQYSLLYAENESVSIGEEIRHINNYLAIEKVRLGRNLQIELDLDEKLMDEKILSFCLQPLLENAIKHGVEALNDGGRLSVKLQRIKSGIYLEVLNPLPARAKEMENLSGMGFKNLKSRMTELYGDTYKMLIHKGEKAFSVKLYLPMLH